LKFKRIDDKKWQEWYKDILKIVGFCRVHYALTASPTLAQKWAFAIFRLCPPTTP